jgi:predicted transcriptional regulator of viral defense system
VPTGRINVSTPEVTVLDLIDAPQFGAGLSNVATVIAELLDINLIDPTALAAQAARYPTAVAQRAGHLIEQMGNEVGASIDLETLRALVDGAPVVDLYPRADRSGERDEQWNVMANIEIEPDL